MFCLSRFLPLSALLVGTTAAQVSTPMQAADLPAPIKSGTYHVQTGVFEPSNGVEKDGGPSASTIFASNIYSGFFYDISDGTEITDEGRVPSTSSPLQASPISFPGVSNSYFITEIQLGYVTDAIGDSTAVLTIYDLYTTCTDPNSAGVPVLKINLTGLPGTISPGTLTPRTFDIDLAGFEFCMQADGDGEYDFGFNDRFGWSLTMQTDPGFAIGPIVGARPGPFAPTGDDTIFTTDTPRPGSGLDTVDQWFDRDPMGVTRCRNWGGYDPTDNDPAFGSFWLVLGADLSVSCASCADLIDDNFEPNDDCNSAPQLTSVPGVFPGLVTFDQSAGTDFYAFEVPAGSSYTATALFTHADADLDMNLFADDCVTLEDLSNSVTDNESVRFTNCSASPTTVIVEVFAFDLGACGEYTLEITEDLTCLVGDTFEPNDSCADAATLPEGLTTGLRITDCDEDFFRISLLPGEQATVSASFNPARTDVDLYVFLDDATCDTTGGILEFSNASFTSTETVSVTNLSGMAQDYILLVDQFPFTSPEGCGEYALVFSREVGTNFCPPTINTSGAAAQIFGTGNAVVSANNFTLNCRFLPPFQFGFFLNSQTSVFVPNPGNSDGNLCIAGPALGRFNQTVTNSGVTGEVSLPVDLTMIPRPMVFQAVVAGETWNFQYWTRDVTLGGSNFSDALAVTFL